MPHEPRTKNRQATPGTDCAYEGLVDALPVIGVRSRMAPSATWFSSKIVWYYVTREHITSVQISAGNSEVRQRPGRQFSFVDFYSCTLVIYGINA